MKTTMTALVLGIATFTIALQGYAEDTSIEKISAEKTSTESIAGTISTIRFENGNVTELKFRDGKVISNPNLHLGEEELAGIDILRVEPLNMSLLQLRDRDSGMQIPCLHFATCDCWRLPPIFSAGNFTLRLNPEGGIEEMVLPDGVKLFEPTFNLKVQPISNADFVEQRTFTLVKVRDRAKGEVIVGIISK